MSVSGTLLKIFAGRWIAGERVEDAVAKTKGLNRRGAKAIINYLGEAEKSTEDVEKTVQKYFEIIERIKRSGIKADIAVKLTALGLGIDDKLLYKNYGLVVGRATKAGIGVWIDMEEYEYVTDTIKTYESLSGNKLTGICIQSYLRRSMKDLERLAKRKAVIRLVKGAYSGPNNVAFPTREETTSNYLALMDYLFKHFSTFTIGTHDPAMVDRALELNRKYKRDVTYAMLNGIHNELLFKLGRSGEQISVYVPFGEKWMRYSYRRLKEASNLKLFIRSIFEKSSG